MNFKITPFLLFFVILIVVSISMVIGNMSVKEGLEPEINNVVPNITSSNNQPTTSVPTTSAPTTAVPTTPEPTRPMYTGSDAPTTPAPTTQSPTTADPTTAAPTTQAPTTQAPTTQAPTTQAPTTQAPTTQAPTCGNVVPDEIKCGDDMACKWYWYFKKRDSSGNQYLTEDYILKTQIVPPVCPSCPSCPSSGGVCTNCGGSGGAGTSGTYTGKDSSGNKIPLDKSGGNQIVVEKSSIVGADAKGNIVVDTSKNKNMTVADYYGNYATTADPDTIGGGLTISGLAFGAGFQGIARDVVDITTDTTSKLGKGLEYVGGGVGNAASGVGQFIDKTATGVGGFVDKTATGVGNFVGNALDNTGRFITDTSGKLVTNNAYGSQNVSPSSYRSPSGALNVNSSSPQYPGDNNRNNTGYVPNKGSVYQTSNVGKVDNYSYYGALQSKGGNFMPVTSDFSKFGR